MEEQITYKEQMIIKHSDNTYSAFLYNEDGDLVEDVSYTLEDAKRYIDNNLRINGGYYDAYGDLISY